MDSRRYVPPPPSPVKLHLSEIPRGYLGTHKTLEHIKRLVYDGAKDFYVRQKAIDILLEQGVQPKDYLGEMNALFKWVQRNVRYTRDTFRVEVLHSARRMLELRAGDCDDMTILLGSMLESIGHPIRLVIMGPDPGRPRFYSHIYLEVNYKGRWIPLDPTMPFPMGWAPMAAVKEIAHLEHRVMKNNAYRGFGTAEVDAGPDNWFTRLLLDLSHRRIQPGDPRLRRLVSILRLRGVYSRNYWLRRFLEGALSQGLKSGPRLRTVRRLLNILARYGLLSKKRADVIFAHMRSGLNLKPSGGKSVHPFSQARLVPLRRELRGFG